MKFNQLIKRDTIPTKTQILGSLQLLEDPRIKQTRKNFEKAYEVYAFNQHKSKFLF